MSRKSLLWTFSRRDSISSGIVASAFGLFAWNSLTYPPSWETRNSFILEMLLLSLLSSSEEIFPDILCAWMRSSSFTALSRRTANSEIFSHISYCVYGSYAAEARVLASSSLFSVSLIDASSESAFPSAFALIEEMTASFIENTSMSPLASAEASLPIVTPASCAAYSEVCISGSAVNLPRDARVAERLRLLRENLSAAKRTS